LPIPPGANVTGECAIQLLIPYSFKFYPSDKRYKASLYRQDRPVRRDQAAASGCRVQFHSPK